MLLATTANLYIFDIQSKIKQSKQEYIINTTILEFTSINMADKKKIKKQDKEEKYKKLLQSIDLKFGNEQADDKQNQINILLDS